MTSLHIHQVSYYNFVRSFHRTHSDTETLLMHRYWTKYKHYMKYLCTIFDCCISQLLISVWIANIQIQTVRNIFEISKVSYSYAHNITIIRSALPCVYATCWSIWNPWRLPSSECLLLQWFDAIKGETYSMVSHPSGCVSCNRYIALDLKLNPLRTVKHNCVF